MGLILLVRHGQASYGSADYDKLSGLGVLQSEFLGAELGRCWPEVSRVVTGTHQRQRDTRRSACAAAEWQVSSEIDARWDEFSTATSAEPPSPTADPHEHVDGGLLPVDRVRWSSGHHDDEYAEPFSAFQSRVAAALEEHALRLGRGEVEVVFTSAGVIGWVAASLLGGGVPGWRAMQHVVVNSSVTRVAVGRRGPTLVSFNEHQHLKPNLITYR